VFPPCLPTSRRRRRSAKALTHLVRKMMTFLLLKPALVLTDREEDPLSRLALDVGKFVFAAPEQREGARVPVRRRRRGPECQ